MEPANRILALAAELDAALPVLDRINRFYDEFHQRSETRRSTENAIIVSDVFVSFYTCVETAFLRISQFFENALDSSRWHEQLLRAMTRTIPSVRERVISDASYAALSELRRFRHFKRYYFAFDYDWGAIGAGSLQVPGLPRAGPDRARRVLGVPSATRRGSAQGLSAHGCGPEITASDPPTARIRRPRQRVAHRSKIAVRSEGT